MKQKKSPEPKAASFNRVAWFYDGLAQVVFAGAIRRSQVALLSFIPAQATVLILGGGTGWLLTDLAQLNKPLEILYLERSSKMLARARRRLTALPPHPLHVTFRLGTEVDLRPGEFFTVIITPFVLDLYPEPVLLPMLHRLQQPLKTDGLWLFVDFYVDRTRAGGPPGWQRRLTQAMYLFFGWLCRLETRTLPDFDRWFRSMPLQLIHNQNFYQGFIRAQVYRRV